MPSVCYKWNNSPFAWNNARLTWKDFCVIQTILAQRVPYSKKRKWYDKYDQFDEKYETQAWDNTRIDSDDEEEKNEKIEIKNLDETEKKAFINLILSMQNKNSKILKEQSKKKNSDIIIDIKNVEIIKTKNNQINLKIDFDEI